MAAPRGTVIIELREATMKATEKTTTPGKPRCLLITLVRSEVLKFEPTSSFAFNLTFRINPEPGKIRGLLITLVRSEVLKFVPTSSFAFNLTIRINPERPSGDGDADTGLHDLPPLGHGAA